jgi:hypothetical protein
MSGGDEGAIQRRIRLLDAIRGRRLPGPLWAAITLRLRVVAEATDLGKALDAMDDLNRLIAQAAATGATRGTPAYRTPVPTETETLLAAGVRNLTVLYREAAPSISGDQAHPADGPRPTPPTKP